MDRPGLRTFIAYVEDVPGVLNRVASLFRRRSYNIESLTVGHSDRSGVSRMTIVMEAADDDAARRVVANLYKLVNVLWVEDVTNADSIVRHLALIKLRVRGAERTRLFRAMAALPAHIASAAEDDVIVEFAGPQEAFDRVLEALKAFQIVEMVRTGAVTMQQGSTPDGATTEGGARTGTGFAAT